MKRILLIGITVLMVAVSFFVWNQQEKPSQGAGLVKIGIFQIADHPALDALRRGFEEQVRQSLGAERVQFDYGNASGDTARIDSLAQRFSTPEFEVVYTIGTSCAQALKAKAPAAKIILGGATDPVSAGLVDDWDRPGGLVTGSTDLPDAERQLEVLHLLVPAVKRIGVVFNPGEDNAVAAVGRFKAAAVARGLAVIERGIASPADIAAAVSSLAGRIDAIYAPPDNTVQSGLAALIRGAHDLGVPVFNCDRNSVVNGALFSVGVDYLDIGRISGAMAVEVVGGRDPATMPIRGGAPQVYVNQTTAARLGIVLPASLSDEAAEVLE